MNYLSRTKYGISIGLLVCGLTGHAATGGGPAAVALVASGLENPSKIIVTGSGLLLVTEAGATPNSGRISIVTSGGARRTLLDGLPSGLAAPDFSPDGPNGLALNGRTLFIANGEGDAHVNGPRTGSIIPNPAGPSSPILATVLQVKFSDDIRYLLGGFSLTLAEHFTLADGKTVTLTNGLGQTATVSLVTALRVDRPDPATIYRNTHLYGIVESPTESDVLYLADAGNNVIWKTEFPGDTPRLVTRFANTANPTFPPTPPPVIEAVPTSVHVLGDRLMVTLLSGAPFVPGTSRVVAVRPATGETVDLIDNLSFVIDAQARNYGTSSYQYFVLEYSTSLATGAPGRLLLFSNGGSKVLASGLTTPSSLAIDENSKTIYITDRNDGTIYKRPLP